MKPQQDIERQEREFKELLQRVLQEPLSPITHSMQSLDDRLDQMEQLVQDLRQVELAALSLDAQDTQKQIRSIKSITEKTPRDIQHVIQPLLQQGLDSIEKSHNSNIEQLQTKLEQSAVEKDGHLADFLRAQLKYQTEQNRQSLIELQGRLLAHNEQINQESASSLERTSQDLIGKISEISISVSKMQATLIAQGEQSSSALERATRDLTVQVSGLAESITKQQIIITAQAEQINRLQQLQSEWSRKFTEQMTQSLQPIRKWLIAAVSLASAGLIVSVAAAVRLF